MSVKMIIVKQQQYLNKKIKKKINVCTITHEHIHLHQLKKKNKICSKTVFKQRREKNIRKKFAKQKTERTLTTSQKKKSIVTGKIKRKQKRK